MSFILTMLLLGIGVITFFTLSAVGHVSNAIKGLAARLEAIFIEGEQSADERRQHTHAYIGKALIEDRLLPYLGFQEPQPSEQERQFDEIIASPEFRQIVEADAKARVKGSTL
jgi:hypothetical protein